MKIAIGTTSELKVRALKSALDQFGVEAEIMPIKVDSGISHQPFGYEETIKGARNRAKEALDKLSPDISVGVENGLIEIEKNYFDVAYVCVISKENEESISFSAGLPIPQWMIDEIKEKNTEGGEITKRLSGDTEKDVGKYFSNGKIKREELLKDAILLALLKILNKEKYKKP